MLILGPQIATYVYIDGFNFYYGAVKDTAFRWLNPTELVRLLLPANTVIAKVKYFTARVSGAVDSDAPRRQQIYFRALRTLPEIEIYYGHFLSKTIWRPLINLPVAGETISSPSPVILPAGDHSVSGSRTQTLPVGTYPTPSPRKGRRKTPRPLSDALVAEVHTMEEKGSDVNLASHLLNDAWKNAFDDAVVISNDTDLVTPIRMVSVERRKPVTVICPGKWQISPPLAAVATHVRHIRKAMLAASQFPNPIPGTTIRKPLSW